MIFEMHDFPCHLSILSKTTKTCMLYVGWQFHHSDCEKIRLTCFFPPDKLDQCLLQSDASVDGLPTCHYHRITGLIDWYIISHAMYATCERIGDTMQPCSKYIYRYRTWFEWKVWTHYVCVHWIKFNGNINTSLFWQHSHHVSVTGPSLEPMQFLSIALLL